LGSEAEKIRNEEGGWKRSMSEMQGSSEIARLREQIAQEYEAAKQVMSGTVYGTANHQFITARMERIGTCHEALKHLVGEREATRMMVKTLEEL
jgi:hypothetical protein